MILTFVILIITILLFIWGKYRPDFVAIVSLLALYLTGILTTDQALSGFSDSTVIMIAALFVVGEGLSRTGVTAWLGSKMLQLAGSSKSRLLIVLMIGTALLSAFISNTGTVATLMPAVVSVSWTIGSVPSQFLIPLAYAANAGGLLTLIGTPPNIVVADVLKNAGYEPFGFFEFTLIGVPLLICAVLYMFLWGQRLLPKRKSGEPPADLTTAMTELGKTYALQEKLYKLRVRRGSDLAGQTLAQAALGRDYQVSVIRIERADEQSHLRPVQNTLDMLGFDSESSIPKADSVIKQGDVLLAEGTEDAIEHLAIRFNLGAQVVSQPQAQPNADDKNDQNQQLTGVLLTREVGLAEILITPRSEYIGQTVSEGQFAQKFNVQVLSIRRRDKLMDRKRSKLAFGDSLLVRGTWEAIGRFKKERRNFVVVGSPEAMAQQIVEPSLQAVIAIFALVLMVVLMLTGVVSTVIATLIAAAIMVFGGCLTMAQTYRAISWSSVILIAAMIPMAVALQVTGGAEFLAEGLVNTLGTIGPVALSAGIFLLTVAFSQVISNTATTVLMAPIALQAAVVLGVSPYPVLMMVVVGASTAFLTPIASPPNTMVMTPGSYAFNDYMKAGLPLTLIFLIVSLILVPLIWPF